MGCFFARKSMQQRFLSALEPCWGFTVLTFTRPDVSYAVQQVCHYMHDPRESHLAALGRILRYVSGTLDYGLQLYSSLTSSLVAYSDADWAGYATTRRSTSAYCVFLGNNLLSQSSKRQHTLSVPVPRQNTVVLPMQLLRHLGCGIFFESFTFLYIMPLLFTVIMSVAKGHVHVLHVPSRYQYADIFTKGLPSALFDRIDVEKKAKADYPPIQRFKGARFNWKSAFRVQVIVMLEWLPALTALNLTDNLTSNDNNVAIKWSQWLNCAIKELHLMGNKMKDITAKRSQLWFNHVPGCIKTRDTNRKAAQMCRDTRWSKIYVQTLPGSLAICRVHGNPQFFVTFTCNVKWPEIKRRADKFLGLKARDKPNGVAQLFEMNVKEMVKFFKERKPLGDIVAGTHD
ncbi:ribonuclease H-like domain-containing protein [Tanacetum coccineum]